MLTDRGCVILPKCHFRIISRTHGTLFTSFSVHHSTFSSNNGSCVRKNGKPTSFSKITAAESVSSAIVGRFGGRFRW